VRHVRWLASLAVLGAALFFTARGEWPWPRPAEVVAAPVPPAEIFTEILDTLRRGETVSEVFSRQGVRAFTLASFADPSIFDLRRLRAGLVFNFRRKLTDSVPSHVIVRTGPEQKVNLRLVGQVWTVDAEPVPWRTELLVLQGEIDNSLYEALDADIADSVLDGGERVHLAWDLADIYAWEIDFSRDIRPGDGFHVLTERLISPEGEVRFGRVLAGNLTVGGASYSAYWFVGPDGKGGFYDQSGHSLRRAFLRAPLQFRRISSRLSSARRHPILGTIRKHEGTDYAADPGTPVMAAGDGTVRQMGWSGGYGNLMELRHANGITTRYGHLRGYADGLRIGAKVKQGDLIGYVGSTGLATGPHLHYEFRIGGVSRDPAKVDLGSGEPVPAPLRADFERERARLSALMNTPSGPTVAVAP
jgi:murein DD-endopeptidase MepM/ murein hydrolase activator NlpD